MAHQIDRTTGDASFAFTGSRKNIWHGLGQQVADDATEQEWIHAARLAWDIKRAPVQFQAPGEHFIREVSDKHVLLRSDTRAALGVVGDGFEVVQPRQQFEFFREFCSKVGARMTTAGALFDGRRIFASAEINGDIRIVGSDVIRPYIMFHTANDGSARTTIRNVATRPVCNNTVRAGMAEKNHGLITISHRSTFNPYSAANEMAVWVKTQHAMAEQFRMLAQTPMLQTRADEIVFGLINDKRSEAAKNNPKRDVRNTAGFQTIMGLFNGAGMGADMPGVRGTAWGLFNAVTEYVDHHATAKTDSHRFDNAQFGAGADMKDAALNKLLALV